MKWLAMGVLALALAGCARAPAASGTGAAVECQRQAYDDPTVKQLMLPTQQGVTTAQAQFQLDTALREATEKCLRQKGVFVRGGVEPVQPH